MRHLHPGRHEKADVLANGAAIAEVVLVGEQTIEQLRVIRARRGNAHVQRTKVTAQACAVPVRMRGQ